MVRNTRADNDIGERDVIKPCLPSSVVLICLFHTLRSFQRKISCEKMSITSGQRTLCLELVQKLAYASSEAKYDRLYTQLQADCLTKVVKCLDKE